MMERYEVEALFLSRLTKGAIDMARSAPPITDGAKLRLLRNEKGLRIVDTAAVAGVGGSHMTNVENGKDDLSMAGLSRLAEFHRLPIDDLTVRTSRSSAQTGDEASLLSLYRRMSAEDARALLTIARAILRHKHE